MCACRTDLQQAMEKAMERIGMKAHVPAFGRHAKLLSSEKQQALLSRVAELEAKLRVLEQ